MNTINSFRNNSIIDCYEQPLGYTTNQGGIQWKHKRIFENRKVTLLRLQNRPVVGNSPAPGQERLKERKAQFKETCKAELKERLRAQGLTSELKERLQAQELKAELKQRLRAQ
ncbi:MAG TPA: hypothetical protein VKA97_13420, partial [Pyrinomonadaceae bacterium]|nr:hypothetical protein [Pyrinomonadaceae bacterium]